MRCSAPFVAVNALLLLFLFAQLDQPELSMPSKEYYLMEGDEIYKNAYLRYMINVAKILGADEVTAERDMTDVLRFEEKLANVSLTNELHQIAAK